MQLLLFKFYSIVSGIPIYGFHMVCVISRLPLLCTAMHFCRVVASTAECTFVYVDDLIITGTIEMNQGVEGITAMFAWLISRTFSANEQYFSLTINQPIVFLAMAY